MKKAQRTRRGRPFADAESRRDQKTAAYVTANEKQLVMTLSTDHGYDGEADVLRRGLALLVKTYHPELLAQLRNDLRTP